MYVAALSLLLIWLAVVVVWQRWDHTERLKALAPSMADVLNYATYWKLAAGEAIRQHNDHIEGWNRVTTAGETGVPLEDVADAIRRRREPEESRTELLNLTRINQRLQSELDRKAGLIVGLSQRADEVARKTGNVGETAQLNQVGRGVEGRPARERSPEGA